MSEQLPEGFDEVKESVWSEKNAKRLQETDLGASCSAKDRKILISKELQAHFWKIRTRRTGKLTWEGKKLSEVFEGYLGEDWNPVNRSWA